MNSVIIKSRNSAELQLSDLEGLLNRKGREYYRVTVNSKNLAATAKVYAYQPGSQLIHFFDDLAANWKGWKGEKQWQSLEGEFTLSCESDSLGHILMEVSLISGFYEDDWNIKVPIVLEAGQLEKIALDIKHFFLKPV